LNTLKPDYEEREQHILDAAAELIVRYGYDKTSMSDIAEEAGVTRAIVYLHFDSKDNLFEALLYREVQKYLRTWWEVFETDPAGGTIAGVFRGALSAVNRTPFISAMLKQDRRVFGNYLRKSGNLFESIQANSLWAMLIQELQEQGAVREDIQPLAFAHIMNALSVGLITVESDKDRGDMAAFEDILDTVATMIDRTLTPAGGGNLDAGREIIRRLALTAQTQFDWAHKTA